VSKASPAPKDPLTPALSIRRPRWTGGRRNWGLPGLVVVCCLLAAVYSAVVPAFEAPDEPGHYAYVTWLLAGNGIPLQGQEPPPLQPEFSQPPLYYLVEAPFAWLAGTQPANLPEWELQHNPFQDKTDYGNVNLYFHLPREGFPWTGAVLGLHLMRLANLVFVALMVLATYGCAIELRWPRPLASIAAALVGLIPQLLFVGGVLNADNAIGSLSALALYLLLRWLNRGPSLRLATLLGLALGLAALSKLSGLAAVGLALAFMGLRSVQRLVLSESSAGAQLTPSRAATLAVPAPPAGRDAAVSTEADGAGNPATAPAAVHSEALGAGTFGWWPKHGSALGVRDTVVAGAVAAVVAGWWYARNWVALGDPLGWGAMLPATGEMLRAAPLDLGSATGRLFVRSYTGLAAFGWSNLFLDDGLYRIALVLGVIGLVGSGVAAARGFRRRRLRLEHWLLPAWFLAFFVSLARWVEVNTAADQWRLLFPAYPALGLLVAFGLYQLVRRHWQPLVVLPAGLLALNIGAIVLTVVPAYAGPATYHGKIEHPTNVRFGDSLQLAGYSTPRPIDGAAGEPVEIDLYWQALAPIGRDYATDLAMLDATGRVVWKRQSMPDEGRAPMALWRPGDLVLDRHRIRVNPSLMIGSQTLLLSVIDPVPPGDHLAAATSDGRRLPNDTVTVGRFLAPPPNLPPPAVKDGIGFRDHLQLAGHTLSPADGALRVTLDWQANGTVSKDYTVFVHLLAADGKQVAQNDSQPGSGAFPTSLLGAGLEVPDTHVLHVAGLAPGDYRLDIGLYDLASGVRLATDKGQTSVTLPAKVP